MQIKDLFEDYKEENIGKSICIELEVARSDSNAIISQNSGKGLRGHAESSRISEICNIHNLETDDRISIYRKTRAMYKHKFPIGYDRHLSGGVHFHAFFKKPLTNPEIADINMVSPRDSIYENMQSLPLFMKIENYKFVARTNCFPSQNYDGPYSESTMGKRFDRYFTGRNSYGGLRQAFRTHNQDYYGTNMSMEFRCNNVIDTRLYGYYIGQMLLVEAGIYLEPLSVKFAANEQRFNSETYIDIKDERLEGFQITSDADKEKLKNNLSVMLDVLRHNGFPVAAKKLREYAKSVAIV